VNARNAAYRELLRQADAERRFQWAGTIHLFRPSSNSARILISAKSAPRNISTNYARAHEFAANVDGESTGKPAASREAVDGHVFNQYWLLVREQAVEAKEYLQVKT